MKKSTFGKIVTKYQKRIDVNQTSIYEGICSSASYQRAETQERDVDFILIETLLARIGKEAVNFELFLSDEDWELRNLRLAVRSAIIGKEFASVEKIIKVYREEINRYKEKKSGKHKLHEQFCMYYEMKLLQWRKEDPDTICQLAARALSLSKDCEQIPHRKKNLYTAMEMDLLLTLIQYRYGKWKNTKEIEECVLEIIEYADIFYSIEQREDIQGKAWIELLRTTEPYVSPDKLLFYINQAITCFAGGTGIGRLGEVHFIKAKLLNRMGDEKNCKEECKMSYCIFEVLGREKELQEVIDYCEGELKWHITTQIWW